MMVEPPFTFYSDPTYARPAATKVLWKKIGAFGQAGQAAFPAALSAAR
jgi:hypothetical protein